MKRSTSKSQPPFDHLVNLIGEAKATELRNLRERVYVPIKLGDQLLVRSLGVEAASKLIEEFGGRSLFMPRQMISRKERNEAIVREINAGMHVNALAKKHQMTVRQIFNIKRQTPINTKGKP